MSERRSKVKPHKMTKIKLKPSLMEKVREGKKRATTRLGIKGYALGVGELVNSEDDEDRLFIMITKLELYTKGWLSVATNVSEMEGYQEPSDLLSALESIYGKIDDDDQLTVVEFKTIGG